MNSAPTTQMRVLALDPFARGFGFVVLEGPQNLIDWGMKEARKNKTARSLEQIAALIEHYQPDVVVVENCMNKSCQRRARVQELIRDILALAAKRQVRISTVSRQRVKTAFAHAGVQTKDTIADVVAQRLPELAQRRPPLRKSWMSEDERMSIFDAAAFALTFFHSENVHNVTG